MPTFPSMSLSTPVSGMFDEKTMAINNNKTQRTFYLLSEMLFQLSEKKLVEWNDGEL